MTTVNFSQITLQVRVSAEHKAEVVDDMRRLAQQLAADGYSQIALYSDNFMEGHKELLGRVHRLEDTQFMGETG